MSWYRTGTVSVTNGNATVTGAGTAFVAIVRAGYGFVGPDGRTYEIDAVVSDTQITLAATYQGATAAAQAYAIFPTQSVIADLATSASELIDSFAAVRDGVGAGLNPDGTAATPAIRFAADQDTGVYRPAANQLGFALGGTQRALLDGTTLALSPAASGYVMSALGATDQWRGVLLGNSATTLGIGIHHSAGGTFFAGRPGAACLTTFDSHSLLLGMNNTAMLEVASLEVKPAADNSIALGASANRWSVVYAGTGTINTSDEREKTWRGELSEAEYHAGLAVIGELGFFQFDDAIEEKGASSARYHFGMRAQRVWAIFADHGLVDPLTDGKPGAAAYGFLCYDEWPSEVAPAHQVETGLVDEAGQPILKTVPESTVRQAGDRFGIRPDELALFLIAVQARRQSEFEARIAALETAAAAS